MRLLLSALLFTCLAKGQVTANIKDKETGKQIPYVNIFVEGEDKGTTADEEGNFKLSAVDPEKNLVLNAIGYSTLNIPVNNLPQTIYLTPAPIQLNEVVLDGKREHLEVQVGKFMKGDLGNWFGCGKVPWMVGRFFPYDTAYVKTPFLKSVALRTYSQIKGAALNIRLYLPDDKGAPGEYFYNENILMTVKKGQKTSVVDISALNLQFPEEGLIIVAEWLIIDKNKYEYEYTIEGSKKRHSGGIMYQPSLGTISDTSGTNSWHYREGRWTNKFPRTPEKNAGKDDYMLLACELVLTN